MVTDIFQIRALRDIPEHGVKKGDLGGYVEGEHNLSQEGSCWIADKEEVCEQARVEEDAYVGGQAVVWDDAVIRGQAVVDGHSSVVFFAISLNLKNMRTQIILTCVSCTDRGNLCKAKFTVFHIDLQKLTAGIYKHQCYAVVSLEDYSINKFIDQLMIGQLGTTEVAAVGIASKLLLLLSMFISSICVGYNILISRALGAGQTFNSVKISKICE